ncbi:hypothetical protein BVRB_9g224570 [Beta vulgaris subsp. vulgaris]|uniref:Uncharacterized protein n=1 Tax=Beta vulgaris subsp. vulgaris TaxID=3555 RepID=A0A0J8B5E9_BETVV|nr:hypothetical protein BVRB_9g224570 [Beta vulgaris subsp. vulgaris]
MVQWWSPVDAECEWQREKESVKLVVLVAERLLYTLMLQMALLKFENCDSSSLKPKTNS